MSGVSAKSLSSSSTIDAGDMRGVSAKRHSYSRASGADDMNGVSAKSHSSSRVSCVEDRRGVSANERSFPCARGVGDRSDVSERDDRKECCDTNIRHLVWSSRLKTETGRGNGNGSRFMSNLVVKSEPKSSNSKADHDVRSTSTTIEAEERRSRGDTHTTVAGDGKLVTAGDASDTDRPPVSATVSPGLAIPERQPTYKDAKSLYELLSCLKPATGRTLRPCVSA